MVDELLVVEDRSRLQQGNEVGELKVVEKVDELGNLMAHTPKSKMVIDSMLKLTVETRNDVLTNFMKNFFKAYKNVKNYHLYAVKVEDGNVKKAVDALQKMLANPSEHKAELKEMRVNPYDYKEKLTVTPELEAKLAEIGLSSEKLQKNGQLDKLLKFQFTDVVYLKCETDETGQEFQHQARIALRTDPETNELSLVTRSVKKEINLDEPFLGMRFDEVDKSMLLEKNNLGRIAQLTSNDGETFNAYVTLDSQTNTLLYQPTRDVKMPRTIGGKELTDEQYNDLINGREVPLQGLKTKAGVEYDATIQYNAEKKNLDFVFPNNRTLSKRTDRVPQSIGGKELSIFQQNALANGKTLYLEGLKNMKTGDIYNSYVSFNKETAKLSFSRFDPTKAKQSEIQQRAQDQGVQRQTKTTQTVNTTTKTTLNQGL